MRHNTSYNDAWISCSTLPNPNTDRGEGHWIMYDLRNQYDLFQFTFWNLNDPRRLDEGIQDLVVDISNNANDWSEVGNFTLPRSDGSSFYSGINAIDLNGITARYVLITATSNYGGACYGLSEVKFGVSEPSLPVTLVDFTAECEDNLVILKWVVNSEFNNESYTGQVSMDGRHWTDIGIIPGANKEEENTYSMKYLSNSSNTEYFRVVQQDLDGSLTYFPVVRADCGAYDNMFSLSPNPVTSSMQVSFSDWNTDNRTFRINDALGRNIRSGIIQSPNMDIELSDLSPGTYFITIGEGNVQYREKFIKI